MFTDFEQRLADVLGARLPPPLRGSVDVAPGRPEAQVVLSVRHAEPLEEHLLTLRPEVVPGSTAQRRVLRLQCNVGFDVRLLNAQTRVDQMRAFDRLIYELDDPAFRPASRCSRAMRPIQVSWCSAWRCRWPIRLRRSRCRRTDSSGRSGPRARPASPSSTPASARRSSRWRCSLRIRGWPRRSAVDLAVQFGSVGTMRVGADGCTSLPFGSVVLAVVDAGGRPGAGTLSGGTAGAGGARIIPVASGQVAFQYTPPPQAAADRLVVALENGEGGVGTELGRFPLNVQGA